MAEHPAVLVLRAVEFAAERHREQRRKGDAGAPYINHPVEVASILAREGGVTDPAILAAALLHDTVEDTTATAEELERLFGPEVREIVEEVSDDKGLPGEVRKRLQVEKAEGYSPAARLVRIADKISNLRDLTSSPPRGWSLARRARYAEWAAEVVDRCRGTNEALERSFDGALAAARAALGGGT